MSNVFRVEEFSGVELKNQPYDFSSTICDDDDVEGLDEYVLVSVLEKRKFDEAFDQTTFEDDRYGQHIASDFFEKNTGHLAHNK